MENPSVQRLHRNGAVARVSYSAERGTYQATMFPPAAGQATATIVRTELRILAQAHDVADHMAHTDCDGRCAPWPTRDPKGAEVSTPRTASRPLGAFS